MPKGYIGESKSEIAINKMVSWLEKSEREKERCPQKRKDESILAQLKENFPDSWEEEFYEMQIEFKNPQYLVEKQQAIKKAHQEYDKKTGMEKKEGPSREVFVMQYLRKWKDEMHLKCKK